MLLSFFDSSELSSMNVQTLDYRLKILSLLRYRVRLHHYVFFDSCKPDLHLNGPPNRADQLNNQKPDDEFLR